MRHDGITVEPDRSLAAQGVEDGFVLSLEPAGDPVELAATYDTEGADEITFLDVSASVADRSTTYDVVQRTASQVFVPLTVGGGVRTTDDVDRLLRSGADKVGVNTAAIYRPELISEIAQRFGSQPNGHHFRMRGRIERAAHGIARFGDDSVLTVGHDRTDRHFAGLGGFHREVERAAHRGRQRKGHRPRLIDCGAAVSGYCWVLPTAAA